MRAAVRAAITTTLTLLVVGLLCVGCSDDKKAGKAEKIKGYRAQLKVLNGQKVELMASPEFKDATTASYKAQAALISAKKGGSDSAIQEAQAAYEESSAAAKEIFAKKDAIEAQINDLQEKIMNLGGTP